MGVFSFLGILYSFYAYTYCCIEFDKMQIPFTAICVYIPILYKVCLATIGVCVFGALASVGALFYFIFNFGGKNVKKKIKTYGVDFYGFVDFGIV